MCKVLINTHQIGITYQTLICSKSITETLENSIKYVKS